MEKRKYHPFRHVHPIFVPRDVHFYTITPLQNISTLVFLYTYIVCFFFCINFIQCINTTFSWIKRNGLYVIKWNVCSWKTCLIFRFSFSGVQNELMRHMLVKFFLYSIISWMYIVIRWSWKVHDTLKDTLVNA